MPPITPRPPAFVTAAASSGPAATFIPGAKRLEVCGTGGESHRKGTHTCQEDGVLYAEQLRDGSRDDGHSSDDRREVELGTMGPRGIDDAPSS
jgi:hypothetical protein